MSNEGEIWLPVPSAPGVEASSLGRIRVAPGAMARTGSWDGERYIIRVKRLRRTFKVARLVCEAFHGPAPEGSPYCLHDDEDSRNNRPGKLLWGTAKQNHNYPGRIAKARARKGFLSAVAVGRARAEAGA